MPVIYPAKLIANDKDNPNDSIKYLIETKVHYGFVLAHHSYMRNLATGHFPAFEISLGKQTGGEKQWHALYKYPVMGIGVWYVDLANPQVLGSGFAIFPYLNFHLKQSRKLTLNFRFGSGMGYLTKKFDRLENYKNIAIGSNFNVFINLYYELKYRLADRFFLSAGIGMAHFSNGSFRTPNLGINIPTVNAGITYALSKGGKMITDHDLAISKEERKIEIQTFLSGGVKEVYPACGDKYSCFSLSTCFLKPLSLKRMIGLGLDVFWQFSIIQTLKSRDIQVKHDYEVIRPGIHIGHQLEFSHFSFINQLGVYLYSLDKSDGPFYLRTAMRYRFNNSRMMVNLALKTHWAKADFVEFGIGYQLK